MADMTMVERVARAMFAAIPWRFSWEDAPEQWRKDHLAKARAAIAALREPTEAMCMAGSGTVGVSGKRRSRETAIWQAMIDAILSEEQPT